ncbi:outer membrane beta-barrel protein [Temperatibacter marinus]|uniref:Outer membrane beta-barrel protein n=1 Tax=Temperatibacter marinus TaxID=1456591 RepID=A0AA52EKB7_9PROT|nr:outer membrane beta-barrel protein [Temperatibacter marinus]WND03809.1 outer membrane beta-barrel protein [Temperatibacter marinus]
MNYLTVFVSSLLILVVSSMASAQSMDFFDRTVEKKFDGIAAGLDFGYTHYKTENAQSTALIGRSNNETFNWGFHGKWRFQHDIGLMLGFTLNHMYLGDKSGAESRTKYTEEDVTYYTTQNVHSKTDLSVSVGYTLGAEYEWLLYSEIGLASARLKMRDFSRDVGERALNTDVRSSFSKSGLLLGLGVEYAFSERILFHTKLNRTKLYQKTGVNEINMVSTGFSYRF